MSDENEEGTAIKLKAEEGGKRQRSSIAFPYMDLNEAVALAKAIHNNVGTHTCSIEQLAPWVKQSPTSSGFRSRLAAARLFGLINADRSDALQLAELGRLVVDAKREREGRAKAFLSVPLYAALHDKFKGSVVPPTAALEKELAALGVASTLTDTARRVMERSAEQAGFYEAGRDRLVLPGFVPTEAPAADGSNDSNGGGVGGSGGGGGGGGEDDLQLDPLLLALLKKIPDPEKGWPAAQRVRWFKTFAMNVSQIYDGDDEPVEMKIEQDKAAN
ncbi:hypothetical protein [Bradyrhizobium mercantei]|uniref:hypothetical protein n=1 Tax=Bradyrhizobium mercantei TaxID=1904807 RepID=UPI000975C450|nr:hypothetical protein [Bradyrhizobium mercantei]